MNYFDKLSSVLWRAKPEMTRSAYIFIVVSVIKRGWFDKRFNQTCL